MKVIRQYNLGSIENLSREHPKTISREPEAKGLYSTLGSRERGTPLPMQSPKRRIGEQRPLIIYSHVSSIIRLMDWVILIQVYV